MQKEDQPPTIVLWGRTGSGKSALGNKIANKLIFKEGHSLSSETINSKIQTVQVQGRNHFFYNL